MSRRSFGGAFLITEEFRAAGECTAIGSFPHERADDALDLILRTMPAIPVWPQLPKRSPEEGMIVQYTEGLPGIVWVRSKNHLFVNTKSASFENEVLEFYNMYLKASESSHPEILEYFQISEDYSEGFNVFKRRLSGLRNLNSIMYLKGHVTGPVTLGLGIPDDTGKATYYDEKLRDIIVKLVSLKAKWQVAELREFGKTVVIFIDEPVLSSFGSSTMISISRDQVINSLNEIIKGIHEAGAISGIHCCGNTDWSMILETDIDILSFDAYDFGDSVFLYPRELVDFLTRGGTIAWGMVPSSIDKIEDVSTENLFIRYENLIQKLVDIGYPVDEAHRASIFTPSCGMGSLDVSTCNTLCAFLSGISSRFKE